MLSMSIFYSHRPEITKYVQSVLPFQVNILPGKSSTIISPCGIWMQFWSILDVVRLWNVKFALNQLRNHSFSDSYAIFSSKLCNLFLCFPDYKKNFDKTGCDSGLSKFARIQKFGYKNFNSGGKIFLISRYFCSKSSKIAISQNV